MEGKGRTSVPGPGSVYIDSEPAISQTPSYTINETPYRNAQDRVFSTPMLEWVLRKRCLNASARSGS